MRQWKYLFLFSWKYIWVHTIGSIFSFFANLGHCWGFFIVNLNKYYYWNILKNIQNLRSRKKCLYSTIEFFLMKLNYSWINWRVFNKKYTRLTQFQGDFFLSMIIFLNAEKKISPSSHRSPICGRIGRCSSFTTIGYWCWGFPRSGRTKSHGSLSVRRSSNTTSWSHTGGTTDATPWIFIRIYRQVRSGSRWWSGTVPWSGNSGLATIESGHGFIVGSSVYGTSSSCNIHAQTSFGFFLDLNTKRIHMYDLCIL